MPMSASARSKKCQLLKQGYTVTQAMNYLMEHGYIKVEPKSADSRNQPISAGNDPLPRGEPETDITEDLWAKCILRLVNESETMTPAIVDKIRDYLDRKNKITQAALERPRPSLEDTHVLVD